MPKQINLPDDDEVIARIDTGWQPIDSIAMNDDFGDFLHRLEAPSVMRPAIMTTMSAGMCAEFGGNWIRPDDPETEWESTLLLYVGASAVPGFTSLLAPIWAQECLRVANLPGIRRLLVNGLATLVPMGVSAPRIITVGMLLAASRVRPDRQGFIGAAR